MPAFPSPMYVLLRNQQYLTVENATTQTFTDETVYDGETYRNLMPAGYIGRAWVAGVPPAGTAEAKDENFSATAPHPLEKTRTRIVWTDGAGNFCGECWQADYMGYSSAPPHFVQ